MSTDPRNAPGDRSVEVENPGRRAFLTGGVALGGVTAGLGATGTAAAAEPSAPNPRLYTCVGGNKGAWAVVSAMAIAGDPLPAAERLEVIHGAAADLPADHAWVLRGVTSNERYATRAEKKKISIQVPLGRPEADYGAFIPIRKSAAWWALTQDERRAIFEERSRHISVGFKYLPAIARRLLHCRDLSEPEPFDFLTIFDFVKADDHAFSDMMAELRGSEEWKYVDREYDMRITRTR